MSTGPRSTRPDAWATRRTRWRRCYTRAPHTPLEAGCWKSVAGSARRRCIWSQRARGAHRRVLRPGGTITAIEGDHGSAFFHPDSAYARAAIDCLIQLQSAAGNALIGRQLAPLLVEAGYRDVVTRTVYADQTQPALVEGFIRNTFSAMIESVRDDALAAGLTTRAGWDRGIADLRAERRCRWNLPLHFLQGFRYEAGCTQ